ncbi:uncharacterized protein LOC132199367 [Neocloeon triangulifer]|uniref:uncharacterized protein LOC132199367 n=1 Tax=Neocloeon triangulifer TaxID=2078957 RepID=UPI00286F2BE6|nr:uncharacterized protein LOC132199367 [Neocloeon triangulifer]
MKLQFSKRGKCSRSVLVTALYLTTLLSAVVAPETGAFSGCVDCNDDLSTGFEVQIESTQTLRLKSISKEIHGRNGKGRILIKKNRRRSFSADQSGAVYKQHKAEATPLKNSVKIFAKERNKEIGANFLFQGKDDNNAIDYKKGIPVIVERGINLKRSVKNKKARPRRGASKKKAPPSDEFGEDIIGEVGSAKYGKIQQVLKIQPKQGNKQRGANAKRNRGNAALGNSQQKAPGKNNYWSKIKNAKETSNRAPKRPINSNGSPNNQQAQYPNYGNYGNPPSQDYGGGASPDYSQYGGNPNFNANPNGNSGPNFNYPTAIPSDLTTMLFTFKGKRAKSTPTWRVPVYGVDTQTPSRPYFQGSGGSNDYGGNRGSSNTGGGNSNQGGVNFNQQGGNNFNQGGNNFNQGGNNFNQGRNNFNQGGSPTGNNNGQGTRRRNTGGQGEREDFLPKNGTKVNRIRKRFQYMQLDSPNEILVAWPFTNPTINPNNPNSGGVNSFVTVLVTAFPSQAATTKKVTVPKVNGEVKNKNPPTTKIPNPKPTPLPKTTTTKGTTTTTPTTTTTEMEFTEETINGSTKGMAVDIDRFQVPSEQPMSMAFNIDEEFTGVIITDFVTSSRRGKPNDDSEKFNMMEGVLKGIVPTAPPTEAGILDDVFNDILKGNKEAIAKETTRTTTTTKPTSKLTTNAQSPSTVRSDAAATPHSNSTVQPSDVTSMSNSTVLPSGSNASLAVTQPATSTVGSTAPGGTKPMKPAVTEPSSDIF